MLLQSEGLPYPLFSYFKKKTKTPKKTKTKRDSGKPFKQVRMQAQITEVKIAKSALVLKFLVTPSAVIFDLNIKYPITSKCDCLGYSSENLKRFGLDLHLRRKFWPMGGHHLLTHLCNEYKSFKQQS